MEKLRLRFILSHAQSIYIVIVRFIMCSPAEYKDPNDLLIQLLISRFVLCTVCQWEGTGALPLRHSQTQVCWTLVVPLRNKNPEYANMTNLFQVPIEDMSKILPAVYSCVTERCHVTWSSCQPKHLSCTQNIHVYTNVQLKSVHSFNTSLYF